jgi:hypothetical protein
MRPQAHKFTVGESVQSHGKGAKTVSATGSLIEQQREERFEDAHLIEYLHDNGATSCPADARNMPHILIDFSEPLIDFEICCSRKRKTIGVTFHTNGEAGSGSVEVFLSTKNVELWHITPSRITVNLEDGAFMTNIEVEFHPYTKGENLGLIVAEDTIEPLCHDAHVSAHYPVKIIATCGPTVEVGEFSPGPFISSREGESRELTLDIENMASLVVGCTIELKISVVNGPDLTNEDTPPFFLEEDEHELSPRENVQVKIFFNAIHAGSYTCAIFININTGESHERQLTAICGPPLLLMDEQVFVKDGDISKMLRQRSHSTPEAGSMEAGTFANSAIVSLDFGIFEWWKRDTVSIKKQQAPSKNVAVLNLTSRPITVSMRPTKTFWTEPSNFELPGYAAQVVKISLRQHGGGILAVSAIEKGRKKMVSESLMIHTNIGTGVIPMGLQLNAFFGEPLQILLTQCNSFLPVHAMESTQLMCPIVNRTPYPMQFKLVCVGEDSKNSQTSFSTDMDLSSQSLPYSMSWCAITYKAPTRMAVEKTRILLVIESPIKCTYVARCCGDDIIMDATSLGVSGASSKDADTTFQYLFKNSIHTDTQKWNAVAAELKGLKEVAGDTLRFAKLTTLPRKEAVRSVLVQQPDTSLLGDFVKTDAHGSTFLLNFSHNNDVSPSDLGVVYTLCSPQFRQSITPKRNDENKTPADPGVQCMKVAEHGADGLLIDILPLPEVPSEHYSLTYGYAAVSNGSMGDVQLVQLVAEKHLQSIQLSAKELNFGPVGPEKTISQAFQVENASAVKYRWYASWKGQALPGEDHKTNDEKHNAEGYGAEQLPEINHFSLSSKKGVIMPFRITQIIVTFSSLVRGHFHEELIIHLQELGHQGKQSSVNKILLGGHTPSQVYIATQ